MLDPHHVTGVGLKLIPSTGLFRNCFVDVAGAVDKVAEGESEKFINNVLQEIFDRQPDSDLKLDLDVFAPNGERIEIRNAAAN
jgi:hypothetical protein